MLGVAPEKVKGLSLATEEVAPNLKLGAELVVASERLGVVELPKAKLGAGLENKAPPTVRLELADSDWLGAVEVESAPNTKLGAEVAVEGAPVNENLAAVVVLEGAPVSDRPVVAVD